MNIQKNITYISDSSGSLLSLSSNMINILLTTEKEILMDTTLDWLNNDIYILTLTTNRKYSIKKFYIEQKKLVEIVSGLDYRPFQIEVDPCNG